MVLFQHDQAATSLDLALAAAAAGHHLKATARIFVERIQLAASTGDLERGLRVVADAEALIASLAEPGPLILELAKSRTLLWRETGDFERALEAANQSLELARDQHGENSLDGAWLRTLIGDLESARGHLTIAREQQQAALAITEARLGPYHPNVALALDRIGQVASQAGDFATALESHQRALEIRQTSSADNDTVEIAASLLHVGAAESGLGHHQLAHQHLARAGKIFEQALGAEHPYVAVALINTAITLVELGRERESVELCRRAMAIREKVYSGDHPKVAKVAYNLGLALRKSGAPAAALPELRRALSIWEQNLAPDHRVRGAALTAIGETLLDLERPLEARPLLEQGLAISTAAETSPDLLGIGQFALARVLDALDRQPSRSLELAHQARQQFLRVAGISRRELAAVDRWLASHQPAGD